MYKVKENFAIEKSDIDNLLLLDNNFYLKNVQMWLPIKDYYVTMRGERFNLSSSYILHNLKEDSATNLK